MLLCGRRPAVRWFNYGLIYAHCEHKYWSGKATMWVLQDQMLVLRRALAVPDVRW